MWLLVLLSIFGLAYAIYTGTLKEWLLGMAKWMGIAYLVGAVLFVFGGAFMLFPKFMGLVVICSLIAWAIGSVISGAVESGIRNSRD